MQPCNVNCAWIQPCYGRGMGGNLTLTELSTQKQLLLAKCEYNALSGCFILCTNRSVQRVNICYSKYLFELAQMVEDCIFGAEVPVFAPC